MMLLLIVLLPFIGSLPPLLLTRWGVRRSGVAWGAAAAPAIALALLLIHGRGVFSGDILEASWPWIPSLGLNLTLRLDGLAYLFALLILAIGLLIILYARYYLSEKDPMGRFYAMLMLFMGAMTGLVISGNILLMAIFWELTSLSSFLLIGYWFQQPAARRGARMALAVTAGGGLALLAGLVLLGHIAGSYELSAVLASREIVQSHPLYVPTLMLILLGAFTKSAQFPFHFWLPQAMTAPTPVSAYLHSATMVKAGVFLLARLFPVLAGTSVWFYTVGTVGLLTLLVGAYAALFKHDLKGLLAYSTISHLGLITLLFGFGTETAAIAGVFHIINHATFKASLFMAAGIVDHEAGTRDMRILNGLWRFMPFTATLAIIASGAMAGVPLLNGFLSKEMFFAESLAAPEVGGGHWLIPTAVTLAGIFAVAYSIRFIHDVFFGGEGIGMPKTPHSPPRFMQIPVEALVLACIAVGVAPALFVKPILTVASAAVVGAPVAPFSLSLWHGFNMPLLMTMVAFVGGILLYTQRLRLWAFHDRYIPSVSGAGIYAAGVSGSERLARVFTGKLENGSLQRYALALVLSAVLAGMIPLFARGWTPGLPETPIMFPDAASIAAWVILILAAFATAVLHRQRLVAMIMISAVGLVVSLAFVRFSAPDLALTQLLVEIVTIILLLLALHFLPRRVPREPGPWRRWRDAFIGATAGAGTAGLAWAVLNRPEDTISGYFVEQAQPLGGGTNIVNIILVDFRGFDTLGEISVLAIAALGIFVMLDGLRADEGDTRRRALDRYPVILKMISRPLLPLALLMSIFLMLRGHNLPGGGFIAGLVAGVALIIQYIASGVDWTTARMRMNFQPVIAAGLLISLLTGLGSLLFGVPFLTSAYRYVTLPVVGKFELATAMLFDLGVFLVVVGVVMLILSRLGKLTTGEEEPAVAFTSEVDAWKP
jgi:multicomponent K+:H+ antiporter subunit A